MCDAALKQAAVLRWFLRGLALELARRKGKVDLEVAECGKWNKSKKAEYLRQNI